MEELEKHSFMSAQNNIYEGATFITLNLRKHRVRKLKYLVQSYTFLPLLMLPLLNKYNKPGMKQTLLTFQGSTGLVCTFLGSDTASGLKDGKYR